MLPESIVNQSDIAARLCRLSRLCGIFNGVVLSRQTWCFVTILSAERPQLSHAWQMGRTFQIRSRNPSPERACHTILKKSK
jgi:hypothetical protein